MRQALTWYVYGLLLLAWGLTAARELNFISAAAYPLERVVGLAVLGAIPFFVLALMVALWPRQVAPMRFEEVREQEEPLAAD